MFRQRIALGVVVLSLLAAGILAGLVAAAQNSPTLVGAATSGQNSVEIIGKITQQGFDVVFAGYATHIDGVPDERLFAEGTSPFARGEATALFTFQGIGAATIRSVLDNLTTTAANVSITWYFNETPLGASFEDLTTFAGGAAIASHDARFQNIINVQEPNVGVFMMYGTVEQLSAEPFTLAGQVYQFGQAGWVGRSENFGQGTRASADPLAAQYVIVGNIIAPFYPAAGQ